MKLKICMLAMWLGGFGICHADTYSVITDTDGAQRMVVTIDKEERIEKVDADIAVVDAEIIKCGTRIADLERGITQWTTKLTKEEERKAKKILERDAIIALPENIMLPVITPSVKPETPE